MSTNVLASGGIRPTSTQWIFPSDAIVQVQRVSALRDSVAPSAGACSNNLEADVLEVLLASPELMVMSGIIRVTIVK